MGIIIINCILYIFAFRDILLLVKVVVHRAGYIRSDSIIANGSDWIVMVYAAYSQSIDDRPK